MKVAAVQRRLDADDKTRAFNAPQKTAVTDDI
jgi:hypothetical protein